MSLISLIGDRKDLGKFKLEREVARSIPSSWSKNVKPLRKGSMVHVYTKMSRQPDLERIHSRSFEYMKRKYDIPDTPQNLQIAKHDVVAPRRIEVTLSVEEAEKISSEIIQSFARKRDMRELLEDAKFFAGASALAGAPGERRARRNIVLTS